MSVISLAQVYMRLLVCCDLSLPMGATQITYGVTNLQERLRCRFESPQRKRSLMPDCYRP